MRKYCKIFLIIVLTFLINTIQVKGESVGSTGNNDNDYGSSEGYKWGWPDEDCKGRQGIRITAYNRNTAEKYGSAFFVNNKDSITEYLNGKYKGNVYIKTNRSERLSEDSDYKGEWTKASEDTFKYLKFLNIFNNVGTDIINFFGFKSEADVVNALKGVYTYVDSTMLENIVLVIEPATYFKDETTGRYYFGTYWDFQYMKNKNDGFRTALHSLFVDPNTFGKAIRIPQNTISDKPQIEKFLEEHFKTFLDNSDGQIQYGVGIILAKNLIQEDPPPEFITNKIPCNTTVTSGSCNSDYYIAEPTRKECVIYNDLYKYKSVGDCGVIYCSQKIKSDLNEFYQTFTPIIRSGSYFKMNNIKIDIEKTCYLKSVSNSNVCSSWTSNIIKDQAKNINLKLISSYNLVEDMAESKFKVTCAEYKNGVCSKTTVTQHIEYALEPNTNRYISIKDMEGTATQTGNDVIDLGGEHLTTPLSLSTGVHKYTLDYTNSILANELGRVLNKKIEVQLSSTNKLELEYKTVSLNSFNSDNLIYSCDYQTKKGYEPPSPPEPDPPIDPPNPPEPDPPIDPPNPPEPPIEDDPPTGFPEVVYRPINLVEAFPGQDGTGRDIGSNWAGYVYNEEGNTINKSNGQPYTKEEYYINYNRGYDDYDIYESEPLYVIKLDYETMGKIREYNDKNKNNYNDFNLKCTLGKGTECISEFLHGDVIKPGGIIESGTCKDVTTSTFYSCVQIIK